MYPEKDEIKLKTFKVITEVRRCFPENDRTFKFVMIKLKLLVISD